MLKTLALALAATVAFIIIVAAARPDPFGREVEASSAQHQRVAEAH